MARKGDAALVDTTDLIDGIYEAAVIPDEWPRVLDMVTQQTSVSRETVRSQLASMLRQTRLNRQAQLVALLSGKGFPDQPDD